MLLPAQRLKLSNDIQQWRREYLSMQIDAISLKGRIVNSDLKQCSHRQLLSLTSREIIWYANVGPIAELYYVGNAFLNDNLHMLLSVLDYGVRTNQLKESVLKNLFEYVCDGYNEGPLSMVSATAPVLSWYLDLGDRLMPRFIKYDWFLDTYATVEQIRPRLIELEAFKQIPEDYLRTFNMLDMDVLSAIRQYDTLKNCSPIPTTQQAPIF